MHLPGGRSSTKGGSAADGVKVVPEIMFDDRGILSDRVFFSQVIHGTPRKARGQAFKCLRIVFHFIVRIIDINDSVCILA